MRLWIQFRLIFRPFSCIHPPTNITICNYHKRLVFHYMSQFNAVIAQCSDLGESKERPSLLLYILISPQLFVIVDPRMFLSDPRSNDTAPISPIFLRYSFDRSEQRYVIFTSTKAETCAFWDLGFAFNTSSFAFAGNVQQNSLSSSKFLSLDFKNQRFLILLLVINRSQNTRFVQRVVLPLQSQDGTRIHNPRPIKSHNF